MKKIKVKLISFILTVAVLSMSVPAVQTWAASTYEVTLKRGMSIAQRKATAKKLHNAMMQGRKIIVHSLAGGKSESYVSRDLFDSVIDKMPYYNDANIGWYWKEEFAYTKDRDPVLGYRLLTKADYIHSAKNSMKYAKEVNWYIKATVPQKENTYSKATLELAQIIHDSLMSKKAYIFWVKGNMKDANTICDNLNSYLKEINQNGVIAMFEKNPNVKKGYCRIVAGDLKPVTEYVYNKNGIWYEKYRKLDKNVVLQEEPVWYNILNGNGNDYLSTTAEDYYWMNKYAEERFSSYKKRIENAVDKVVTKTMEKEGTTDKDKVYQEIYPSLYRYAQNMLDANGMSDLSGALKLYCVFRDEKVYGFKNTEKMFHEPPAINYPSFKKLYKQTEEGGSDDEIMYLAEISSYLDLDVQCSIGRDATAGLPSWVIIHAENADGQTMELQSDATVGSLLSSWDCEDATGAITGSKDYADKHEGVIYIFQVLY